MQLARIKQQNYLELLKRFRMERGRTEGMADWRIA